MRTPLLVLVLLASCAADKAVTKAGDSTAATMDAVRAVIAPPPTPTTVAEKSMVSAGIEFVRAAIELWQAHEHQPDLDAPPFAPDDAGAP